MRGWLTPAAVIGAVLLLPACSSAPSSRANWQATQFQNLLPAAENGNLEAQDDIGYLYQTGAGTPVDERQAVIWYRRAAEQGYADSERHLGYMYAEGLGVPRDYAQALIWYQRAARQGDAWAENNIGSLYETGDGVPRDYPLALLWFTRAASQRNPAAEVNLGDLYAAGLGTQRDYDAARQWYVLAAVHGDFNAQLRLGRLYANGWGVARDQGQASYWFDRAANHRFDSATNFRAAVKAIIAAHARAVRSADAAPTAGSAVVAFTYQDRKAVQVHIATSSGNAAVDTAARQAVTGSMLPPPPAELLKDASFKLAITPISRGAP